MLVILIFTVGVGFTATDTVAVPVHPPELPVTVYVVAEVGDAVVVSLLVFVSPVPGLHV
jgi:hypothetical protein